jgi:DNA-binding NarL/FixJ family response regulator
MSAIRAALGVSRWYASKIRQGYRIREMLPELTKSIPHEPDGRPQSLTDIQKTEVCREIASLYGRGLRLGIAIKRVAQKFRVSERTVRRAWQSRDQGAPP